MTLDKFQRLAEFEEVVGNLFSIEITELGLIAQVSKVRVLLPEELAGRLGGLVGRRIGILRLDGYRVRHLQGKEINVDGNHKTTSERDHETSEG